MEYGIRKEKLSEAKYKGSWRSRFMDYEDKEKIASHTLAKVFAGK